MQLPERFKIYFWDVDWEDLKIQVRKYQNFIISRLCDKGDVADIKWLLNNYSKAEITDIVAKNRSVSPKTKSFWTNWTENV